MRGRIPSIGLTIAALLLTAGNAIAEWPYLTEEAANLSHGHYSLSLGVGRTDHQSESRFYGMELLTPPEGVYWHLPQVQGTLGVGPRAEVSFDYEFLHFRPPNGGKEHWETGDLRLWTKLGLLRAGRQALSLRFGVKLPNSARLGSNETDFFVAGLYDLALGEWVATANAGLGVIGSPAHEQSQDDVFQWGAALRWRGGADGLQTGVEASGQSGPYGLQRQREGRWYAAVLGWQWGPWRLDGALRQGVHDWEGWAWVAGVTYGR